MLLPSEGRQIHTVLRGGAGRGEGGDGGGERAANGRCPRRGGRGSPHRGIRSAHRPEVEGGVRGRGRRYSRRRRRGRAGSRHTMVRGGGPNPAYSS